jgi:hypothetical protein
VFGTVVHQDGAELTVAKRNGDLVAVDVTEAFAHSRAAQPSVGHGISVRGIYAVGGVLQADTLLHAKDNPALWPADR